ncbi:DUF6165 family protein [Novosphingobium resinovorum]|uniref:DUF6165 family protein n=1 Tax=Novosphingobium TaxID=165696 RepID=UPI001B3C69D8|nr:MULTISPECIES: DUF6165 family protein [Novosphingobium]MBF7013822.1 hypothetical protein [Novosphingobium sp. HR1a]WJM25966.1 DUF6165 family protein [Novosphingobium resinovorum]
MTTVPCVPVSWGELLDKITILDIKRARLPPGPALANVEKEHAALTRAAAEIVRTPGLGALMERLQRINETLWNIEGAIREQEAQARFGPRFVALARSIYQTNDTRAAIKREINLLLDCELVEEKSYAAAIAPPVMPSLVAGHTN